MTGCRHDMTKTLNSLILQITSLYPSARNHNLQIWFLIMFEINAFTFTSVEYLLSGHSLPDAWLANLVTALQFFFFFFSIKGNETTFAAKEEPVLCH